MSKVIESISTWGILAIIKEYKGDNGNETVESFLDLLFKNKKEPDKVLALCEWDTIKNNENFIQDFNNINNITLNQLEEWMSNVDVGVAFIDTLGGWHCSGIGINPNGVRCLDCNRLACSGCQNATKLEETIRQSTKIADKK